MSGKMMKNGEAIKFLLDNGLLFEINRHILHPLGLSLSMRVDGESYEFEGLWDCESSEGICFDEKALEEGHQKYTSYMSKEGFNKFTSRYEKLGYLYQEIPAKDVILKNSIEFKESLFGETSDETNNQDEKNDKVECSEKEEGDKK